MKQFLLTVCIFFVVGVAEPRIHGFFIQPSLGYGGIDYDNSTFGSQGQYDGWIQSMADVGASQLIYQWSARYEYNQTWYSSAYAGTPSNAEFAYYNIDQDTINGIPTQSWTAPTSWPGKDTCALERALVACEKAGIKLWFGLYLNENSSSYNWWDANSDNTITAQDSSIIEHHVARSLSMIDDIAAQYGSHPAFGGFYYTVEVANVAFIAPENHAYLASILDRVADRAHQKVPGCRISISPFFNTLIGSASEYGAMWEYALENSDFDLVILQDGAGVDPFSLTPSKNEITPFYEAVKIAVDKTGKSLWANAELFTQDQGGMRLSPKFIPSNVERLKQQFEAEEASVDTFVCFGFEYMDPNPLHKFTAGHLGSLGNEATLRKNFYDSYKQYYDTLKLVTPIRLASNPTHRKLSVVTREREISFTSAAAQATYRIVTVSGRLVAEGALISGQTIPLNEWGSGVYLYEVLLDGMSVRGNFALK